MNIGERIQNIKSGFHPSFWVANIMELFERLAYYGQNIILVVFIREFLHYDEIKSSQLSSIFGTLIYFLPIFSGTLVDKYGFRKSFMIAFGILACGYFLIGTMGFEAFRAFYGNTDLYWLMAAILAFTAVGGSFIKPAVLGTVARTAKPETKSLGFAVYYMLVNMGAAIGPFIAYFVRMSAGMQYVYIVSAITSALMLISTIIFFKEPPVQAGELGGSLGEKLRNLFVVLGNIKFTIFLMIFSLFWLIFWQIFIIIPLYISDFISKDAPFEIIGSMGAWTIVFLQIPVNWMTKKLPTQKAILLGFGIAAFSWLFIGLYPSVPVIIFAMAVFSIGEMTQAPRYYEYISDIAPKGQLGLFQGYAFLPIAIGYAIGGTFGGWLYKTYAKGMGTPSVVFYVLFFIGIAALALMFLYTKTLGKKEA